MKKTKIKVSNCKKHKEEIIKRWKEGTTLVNLMREFHCHNTYIKKLLVETIGEKAYRKGCRERTGRGHIQIQHISRLVDRKDSK